MTIYNKIFPVMGLFRRSVFIKVANQKKITQRRGRDEPQLISSVSYTLL